MITSTYRNILISLVALLLIVACIVSETATPVSRSDPNAFNTAVAQTAAAASPMPFGNTPVPPTSVATTQASSDEQAIRQALLEKLVYWTDSDMDVTATFLDGTAAYGTVKRKGQEGGAGWFAVKDNGKWVVLQVGQGWPPCRALEPYNIPVSDIPNCNDDSGMVVDRSATGNSAPPSNPTVAAPPAGDAYAPDPLGPAWTGFWIDQGACYDLDSFSATNTTACDVSLGADNTFTPQNGATIEGAAYQSVPSLNTCKSAALSSAPVSLLNITYVCFKTDAGKYGFIVPREIQAGGVIFDAYLFP
jgi:hypothetical protein